MENSLIGEKTIAFSIAHEILESSVKIPPIPANGRKILEIVRQPKNKIDIPTFVKLVESDPGLFIRILELSNSSYYSEVEKIVSLKAAITRIGLIEIVDSVCLYFFQKMLPKFPDIDGFTYNDFWAHSWATAVANRRLGHPNLEMDILPGDLYMAGMLHGIGKLMMAIHYPKDFSSCIKKAIDLKVPLYKMEMDTFGTSDALVTSAVLKSWKLPPNICEGVAYHLTPELAPPEYRLVAGLTQYAYGIAQLSETGSSGDGCNIVLSESFLGKKPNLKLSKPNIREKLIQEIFESIKGKTQAVTLSKAAGKSPSRTANASNRSTARKRKTAAPEKKGVIRWVKSLLK
jgi:HD-like signal output (HDOD) protein